MVNQSGLHNLDLHKPFALILLVRHRGLNLQFAKLRSEWPPNCHLGRTLITDFFPVVYYPRDTRVSSALVHWEHGEIKTLVLSKIRWMYGKSVELTESQWNCDGMSPWQNSNEKSVGNSSWFRRILHVPSVLGPNWLFLGRLGLHKRIGPRKFIRNT